MPTITVPKPRPARQRQPLFTTKGLILDRPIPAPSARSYAVGVDRLILTAVVAATVVLAAVAYIEYLDFTRLRWGSLVHDRNAHYLLGLNLACDVQCGDGRRLLADLDGARTWPPLHGVLVAAVLVGGGLNHQLAVLPSLAAWVGTVVFGFLVARRTAPRYGNAAGLVAAAFILASPAHHAYATDVMLESGGACLSLLAIYLYLVAVQGRSAGAEGGLGLALTALFFYKYNYWALVVAALLVAELCDRVWDRPSWRRVGELSAGCRRWLVNQAQSPLTYVTLALLAAALVVTAGAGQSIPVGGTEVSVRSPHNLLHAAYVLVFARVAWSWARGHRGWAAGLAPRYRRLLLWHGLPVALWFLWPKRLGYCLWYLLANKGENPQHGLVESLTFYASSLANDYHLAQWSVLLAGGLFALALLRGLRLRPGGRAVVLFVLIAAAATLPHPNRKSRFLHSWVPAGWIIAGVGVTGLVPRGRRAGWAGPATAATAAAAIVLVHAPGFLSAGDSPERGHRGYLAASTFDLTDYLLPQLDGSQRAAVFATLDMRHCLRSSFLERYGRRRQLEVEWKGYGASAGENRRRFQEWLATTSCDTLVFIDVPRASYLHEPTGHNPFFAEQLPELLASQTAFTPLTTRYFSLYRCTVSVYRR
jgi:hypothetical protein